MKRRMLSGAMCAGLLVATMGPATLAQTPVAGSPVSGEAATADPGQDVKMMLLPKFLGILPFDQANTGAQEAAAELQNPTPFDFVGPTAENSVAGQIEFVTNAPAGGYDVVMLSNNSGEQIAPAAVAAQEAGTQVVTWDSFIPSGDGEGARERGVRQHRAAGDGLRRRSVREELRASPGSPLQVPRHGADHGPD